MTCLPDPPDLRTLFSLKNTLAVLLAFWDEIKVLVVQLCLTLCNSMDCMQPARFLCPWNSPGKNTGVGCHSLLQGIFSTQGSNPDLTHCKQILYLLSHQGSSLNMVLVLKLLKRQLEMQRDYNHDTISKCSTARQPWTRKRESVVWPGVRKQLQE